MTVTEALRITQRAPRDAEPFEIGLACAFTPLHLQTFLQAHLQACLPAKRVIVRAGLYGATVHTLESPTGDAKGVVVALEGVDLDPRLGFREAGQWGPNALPEILSNARQTLERLGDSIQRLSQKVRCAVSLPTLPLPPVFHAPGWQAGESELLLEQLLADFSSRLVRY
ncbi:MAG TPA: hypothetical protein VNH18_24655, partial [Bryobacteraceae bacterium]|nr:hypothetical protein [Bryobacteraceae bacterium]